METMERLFTNISNLVGFNFTLEESGKILGPKGEEIGIYLFDLESEIRKDISLVYIKDQGKGLDRLRELIYSKLEELRGYKGLGLNIQTESEQGEIEVNPQSLEKYFQRKIDITETLLKEIDKHVDKKPETYLELILEQDFTKIYFLEQLGVIEFLQRKFGIVSEAKIGEILHPITKVIPDTTRTYLKRIRTGEISPAQETEVSNTFNRLKLKRVKN